MRTIFIFLLLVFLPPMSNSGLLLGQAGEQWLVKNLDKEILPSSERIAFVSNSSAGFYYFGNTTGLTVYDGFAAKMLTIKDPASPVLHDQMVQSRMYEDATGQLWFSTYAALHAYDELSQSFRTFQITTGEQTIEENYHVFYINPLGNEVWLKAGEYLWAFDCQKQQFQRLGGPTKGYRYLVHELVSGEQKIIGCPFLYGSGIEVFNLRTGVQVIPRNLNFSEKITSIVAIDEEQFLLGSTSGLLELTLTDEDFSLSRFSSPILDGPVWDLAITPTQDFVWISKLDTGLLLYSLDKQEVVDVIGEPQGLTSNDPKDLLLTPEGILWAGQYKNGLDLISLPQKNLSLLPINEHLHAAIGSIPGGRLFAASNHAVWQSTNQSSVKQWKKTTIPPNSKHPPYNSKFFSVKDRLYLQGQGQIWRYQQQSNQWKTYTSSGYPIKGLMIGPPGELLCLSDQGVQICQEKADTLLCQNSTVFSPEPTNEFLGIFQLTDSTFLLPWRGREAWIGLLQDQNYQLIERIVVPGEIQAALSLPGSQDIYVGGSAGLHLLQRGVSTSINLNVFEDKQINVEALTVDKSGNIWIGTRDGLYQYDPKQCAAVYFSTADGLPSNRFTEATPVLFRDSIMMMTNEGSFAFHPEHLLPDTSLLTPYLLNTRVNDQKILQLLNLDNPSEQLILPHRKNTLDFRVANVGLRQEGYSALQYQLLGYESNPIRTPPHSTIRYPNLPPGNYTLQLTAINRNGLPSGKKSLDITIRPPFTQTLLFYVLCTCGLALFAAGLYFLGLRRERLKQQRLQEQQTRLAAERDRIAGEVHDDLGGQISSILYLSEEMLLTGETPEYEYELNRINELSRNSLQNVRDIIFALDNRRASLFALGEQLSGAGEAFFGDRKISFRHSEKFSQPEFVLSSRQKRNLTLIVKEAWHNIAKHAKATAVTLDIKQADQELVITVTDNGVGFASAASENSMGGYGLDNMQDKATAIGGQLAIDSTPGQGTTLRLNWPLPETDKKLKKS
ncbi:MAG: ATP-binding protein [Lewinella sp.]